MIRGTKAAGGDASSSLQTNNNNNSKKRTRSGSPLPNNNDDVDTNDSSSTAAAATAEVVVSDDDDDTDVLPSPKLLMKTTDQAIVISGAAANNTAAASGSSGKAASDAAKKAKGFFTGSKTTNLATDNASKKHAPKRTKVPSTKTSAATSRFNASRLQQLLQAQQFSTNSTSSSYIKDAFDLNGVRALAAVGAEEREHAREQSSVEFNVLLPEQRRKIIIDYYTKQIEKSIAVDREEKRMRQALSGTSSKSTNGAGVVNKKAVVKKTKSINAATGGDDADADDAADDDDDDDDDVSIGLPDYFTNTKKTTDKPPPPIDQVDFEDMEELIQINVRKSQIRKQVMNYFTKERGWKFDVVKRYLSEFINEGKTEACKHTGPRKRRNPEYNEERRRVHDCYKHAFEEAQGDVSLISVRPLCLKLGIDRSKFWRMLNDKSPFDGETGGDDAEATKNAAADGGEDEEGNPIKNIRAQIAARQLQDEIYYEARRSIIIAYFINQTSGEYKERRNATVRHFMAAAPATLKQAIISSIVDRFVKSGSIRSAARLKQMLADFRSQEAIEVNKQIGVRALELTADEKLYFDNLDTLQEEYESGGQASARFVPSGADNVTMRQARAAVHKMKRNTDTTTGKAATSITKKK